MQTSADAEIEAFHQAGRRRKAATFGYVAAIAIVGGAVAIVAALMGFGVAQEARHYTRAIDMRLGTYTLIGGVVLLIVGFGALGKTYSLLRGDANE